MLLIAQPKSGSTSLLYSIGKILKLRIKNGQNKLKDDIKCSRYFETQKYHGTTVKRNYDFLKKYIEDRTVIYKEHILPIKSHLDIIKKINKNVVVLIREPEEIIESYKRVFSVMFNLKINYERLLDEMKEFYSVYSAFDSDKRFLIITYKDIVLNFTETIKKIIKHYNFKTPVNIHKYELEKRNYTGHGEKKLNEFCD
jgi:hypothetical protein